MLALLLVWAAYGPSLGHLPREDQRFYLADTLGCHDWSSLIERSVSYNRTRLCRPGDSALFRPALFLIRAAERRLLGFDFAAWQAISLGLLLLTVVRLRTFLRRYLPESTAALLALLYAVTPVNAECVTWQHINGYLLFQFLLISFLHHLGRSEDHPEDVLAPRLAIAHLTLACLAYELGVIVSAIAVVACCFSGSAAMRRRAPLLAIPAVLYLLLSGVDGILRLNAGQFSPVSGVAGAWSVEYFSLGLLLLPIVWTAPLLFPASMGYLVSKRLNLVSAHPGLLAGGSRPGITEEVLAWAVVLGLAFYLSRRSTSSQPDPSPRGRLVFRVTVATVCAYLLLMAAGRLATRDLRWAMSNLAWGSTWCTLVWSLAASSGWFAPGGADQAARFRGRILACAALPLIVTGGLVTRGLCIEFEREHAPSRAFLVQLGDFVNAHRDEPGFRFGFSRVPDEDTWEAGALGVIGTYNGHRIDEGRYSQVLYGDLMSDSPTWLLSWENGRMQAGRTP